MFRRFGRLLAQQSVGVLALVVALSSGTAFAAAAMWTGANIVDGSLTGADIGNGTLTGADIAPGSITSADLAPGVGGAGAPAPLAVINTAALSFTAAASPQVLATQSFTVPEDGFVDVHYSAQLTADADACSGDYWFTNVYVKVDNADYPLAGVYLDRVPTVGRDNSHVGQVWLAAGVHELEVVNADTICDAPVGQFHVNGLHVSAKLA